MSTLINTQTGKIESVKVDGSTIVASDLTSSKALYILGSIEGRLEYRTIVENRASGRAQSPEVESLQTATNAVRSAKVAVLDQIHIERSKGGRS